MTDKVRVRFAPSPTGALHIGNVRAALFNWLFCKKEGGSLILRMEDTDKVRSDKESEENILKNLAWLGIEFDEGPDIGGAFAPYRQSERNSIYIEHLDRLIKDGKVYNCYCTKEELEKEKEKRIRASKMPCYSGRCRNLDKTEEEKLIEEGRKPAVRLLLKNKTVSFRDLIKGNISYKTSSLGGDFIIRRSNGDFVYNFTVVIDDALMKVSHVIRGEDHLTNTIKQILLYEALGMTPPEFAHCPLIIGEDKKKLKKRDFIDVFNKFKDDGILPQAVMNYTALLGWSSGDGNEIFTKDELIKRFHLSSVSSSPSVFIYDKLKWVNSEHIKLLDDKSFSSLLFDFLKKRHSEEILNEFSIDLNEVDKERFLKFSKLIKDSVAVLKDAISYINMFLGEEVKPSDDAAKALKADGAADVINSFLKHLEKESSLDDEAYVRITDHIKDELNINGKTLFMPLRASVTGSTKGPKLHELFTFLGKEKVIERMK